MSKAQYDIYLGKVLTLAKTVVVKSQATADAINRGLSEVGISVNSADPASWKYYLNLNGQYHSTDRPMTVTSLDTLQTIDFTKQNLLIHRATAREYVFGSRYYNDLIERFPSQEMLIRGILNPVDIPTAIAAADGEVLYYDAELVEENETNLIPQLSDWCVNYMVRWNVRAYTMTDDLYAAAQLGGLFMQIPLVILNLRLENCHTQYAHSYHIREYLASNGRLDVYVDNLTKKQMLWLYRNIRYIHRNAGKRETFDLLVKNVLTDRSLPLAEWSMRHNLQDQLDEIYPDIEFVRKPLNFGYSSAGADTRTIEQMLIEERGVARGNERVEEAAIPQITEQMENSLNNRLSTKVLESSVLDLTDSEFFTLSDCLLNHWLFFAVTDRYQAIITVDNPKTGGTLTFNMLDAFIVFLYAYNRSIGYTLETIPALEAIKVRRVPTPPREELVGLVDPLLVSPAQIDEAYTDLPTIGTYISTAAFHDAGLAIHASLLRHRRMYTSCEHYVQRGQVEQMVGRLYCNYPCQLAAPDTAYNDWFNDHGLDIWSFSALECELLAKSILDTATGVDLVVAQSLKDMQGAMLRLMAQLSSYSIQFLQSINTQAIRVIDWPVIRPGNDFSKMADHIPVDAVDTQVLEFDAMSHHLEVLTNEEMSIGVTPFMRQRDKIFVNMSMDCHPRIFVHLRERVENPSMRILNWADPSNVVSPDEPDSEV